MLARITYILFILFQKLLFILPRKLRYYLANGLGVILFYLIAKRRKIAIDNIQSHLGYSKSEARSLTKEVFKDVAFKLTEIMTLTAWGEKEFKARIEADNLDKLRKLYNQQQPVILFTGHLGNWELLGVYLAYLGYPMNAIAKEQNNEYIYQQILKIRTSQGGNVYTKKEIKQIYKSLLNNEFMLILGDQNKRSGVFIDFLDDAAATAKGPVYLARKTGAAIVPVFLIKQSDNKYKLIVKDAVKVAKDSSKKERLETLQQLHDQLEAVVKKYPKQWLWLHRRWKTRPEATDDKKRLTIDN